MPGPTLGTREWTALLNQIRNNDTTLTSLDLRENQIGASGAKALNAALKDNRTLTTLDLRVPENQDAVIDDDNPDRQELLNNNSLR